MKLIDKQLLDGVSRQAQKSERLRMNYNFHQSLDDKCHRFLNAVEPGTKVEIHRHPTKDETFVLLRGWVRVTMHNDDRSIIEDIVLCPEEGKKGVNIPKGIWHGGTGGRVIDIRYKNQGNSLIRSGVSACCLGDG